MDTKFDLLKTLDEYLNNKKSPPRERSYFYISEVGKSKKEIFESIKNKKGFDFDAKTKRILDNGDYMHMRYYKYFAEMGILVAAEIDVSKDDLFHGRCDAIITDKEKNYIVDLKSCSQWTFQKLKEPQKEHVLQVMMYMYYSGIHNGMLLYECKDNQSIKIFEVKYDDLIINKIISEFKILKENIANNIMPSNEPIKLDDIQYNGI